MMARSAIVLDSESYTRLPPSFQPLRLAVGPLVAFPRWFRQLSLSAGEEEVKKNPVDRGVEGNDVRGVELHR
jgi:hypothetical protein